MSNKYILMSLVTLVLMGSGVFAYTANANHAWGGYHWARSSNPFTLKLGDNVTANWDSYLQTSVFDWSESNVLDVVSVAGASNPKNCKPMAGRVEICNSKYGNNGWLGIASIWASGEHITQGTVKMNDTYFNTAKYNTPAWKNLVMCQEIGHTFGLDHQDENFNNLNLGTCMDYTSDPETNQHPNAHDYEMLEAIYAHLDSETAVKQSPSANRQEVDHSDPATWGKSIRKDDKDRGELFVRDLGNGNRVFTFVVWAE